MDHDTSTETLELRTVLGGRTVAEFADQPKAERQKSYRAHLHDVAIFHISHDESGFDAEQAGMMLLRGNYMGRDEVGERLVKEAREYFYRENMFVVSPHRLVDFIRDPLADSPTDGVRVAVEELVRRITVRITTDKANGQDLQHLLKFTNAPRIDIELWVGGPMNGMDLATQQVIREISTAVKELIVHFGTCVSIRKESIGSRPFDLRPYWDAPAVDAVEKIRKGGACSFGDFMPIQIAKWTDAQPNLFDRDDDSVSLV